MNTLAILVGFFFDMLRAWSPVVAIGAACLAAKMFATARSNAAIRAARRVRA